MKMTETEDEIQSFSVWGGAIGFGQITRVNLVILLITGLSLCGCSDGKETKGVIDMSRSSRESLRSEVLTSNTNKVKNDVKDRMQDVVLARSGQSCTSIVAPGTNEVEQFAASELARYLSQMGSCTFRVGSDAPDTKGIQIAIGTPTSLAPWLSDPGLAERTRALKEESFLISVRAERILIIGATPRAALYGVYDLLEDDFSARWTIPGLQGEFIPTQDVLNIKLGERVESPAFALRAFESAAGIKNTDVNGEIAIIDWMAKRKMNLYRIAWCYIDWDMYETRLRPEILKRGLMGGAGNHSFGQVLPPEKYAVQHPEYFAMRNGVRVTNDPKMPKRFGLHLCTENPAVVAAVASELDARLRKFPELTQVGLLPADFSTFCQCQNCSPLIEGTSEKMWPGENVSKASALLLKFVNNVNRAVKPNHPQLGVWFEAYSPTIEPPNSLTPDADVNVYAWIYWRCFLHSLGDTTCNRSRQYAEALRGWRRITKGQMMVADYWSGLTQPVPLWPTMTMKGDYEFLHSIGVEGVCAWGLSEKYFEMAEMSAYLSSELLWDLKQDTWQAIRRFCEGRYGAAADSMLQYYREVARGMEQAAAQNPTSRCPNTWPHVAKFVLEPERLRSLVSEAREKAQSPLARSGVEDAWIKNEYMILLAAVAQADAACGKAIGDRDNVRARAAITDLRRAATSFAQFFREHLKSGTYYGNTSGTDNAVVARESAVLSLEKSVAASGLVADDGVELIKNGDFKGGHDGWNIFDGVVLKRNNVPCLKTTHDYLLAYQDIVMGTLMETLKNGRIACAFTACGDNNPKIGVTLQCFDSNKNEIGTEQKIIWDVPLAGEPQDVREILKGNLLLKDAVVEKTAFVRMRIYCTDMGNNLEGQIYLEKVSLTIVKE